MGSTNAQSSGMTGRARAARRVPQRVSGWALVLLVAGLVAVGVRAAPAHAAVTITVNTTADSQPSAGECSGIAGDCSLRQAIDKAASGDTIGFASGVQGTITLAHGQIAFSKALTINGPGASKLTIDAGGRSQIFVIDSSGASDVVAISGLTLEHGATTAVFANGGAIDDETGTGALSVSDSTLDSNTAATPGNGNAQGGAIFSHGEVTVTDSTVDFNTASATGSGSSNAQAGAILAYGALTITGSTLDSNTATSNSQGGAGAGGAIVSATVAHVTDSTLEGNAASGTNDGSGLGGAIDSEGTLSVSGSTITTNTVTGSGTGGTNADGGAIYSGGAVSVSASTLDSNGASAGDAFGGAVYSPEAVTVTGSTLDSNIVTATGTGAIAASGGAIFSTITVSVTGSSLDSNAANGGNGGAIASEGTVSVAGSTLSSNMAVATDTDLPTGGRGGAITSEGAASVTDSTLYGNHGTAAAGALFLGNTAMLESDTIDANYSSGSGVGGIEGAGKVTAEATIVAQNTTGGAEGASSNCDAPVKSSDHSLENDAGNSCGFDLPAADPELNAPADNGATSTLPGGSHLLTQSERAGSPAIDAVPKANCPTSSDERGFARPEAAEPDCDIGAFEAYEPSVTISSPASGGSYAAGASVSTSFSCTEDAGGPGLSSCDDSTGTDTTAGGSGHLDTSRPGSFTYTVTATSKGGLRAVMSISYTVVVDAAGTPSPAPTSTRLSSSARRAVTGERVIYTATVSDRPDGGRVELLQAGRPLRGCRALPLHGEKAKCTTVYGRRARHRVRAVYTGDARFAGSRSATITETVVPSARLIGRPSTRHDLVRLTIACARHSGGCQIQALLTIRPHRGAAHSRRRHHTRIGHSRKLIAAGHRRRLAIKLDRAARRLIDRHGKLASTLTIDLTVVKQHDQIAKRRLILKRPRHREP